MEEYESFVIAIDWRHWERGGDPDLQSVVIPKDGWRAGREPCPDFTLWDGKERKTNLGAAPGFFALFSCQITSILYLHYWFTGECAVACYRVTLSQDLLGMFIPLFSCGFIQTPCKELWEKLSSVVHESLLKWQPLLLLTCMILGRAKESWWTFLGWRCQMGKNGEYLEH